MPTSWHGCELRQAQRSKRRRQTSSSETTGTSKSSPGKPNGCGWSCRPWRLAIVDRDRLLRRGGDDRASPSLVRGAVRRDVRAWRLRGLAGRRPQGAGTAFPPPARHRRGFGRPEPLLLARGLLYLLDPPLRTLLRGPRHRRRRYAGEALPGLLELRVLPAVRRRGSRSGGPRRRRLQVGAHI